MEKTMQNPKLIPVPFANSGIKDDIPKVKSTSMSDEKASWETGFPEATMLPVYAGGLPPDGKDFNGVLNQISENLVFQSKGGRYKFDPDFALSIGGYPKGATLQTNDESAEYQSLIDNNLVNFNTATPEEITQAWRITGLGDAIEVLNGKFDKASVKNELGLSQTEVVSQKVVTELGSGVVGSFEDGLNFIEELTSSDQQVTLENEFGKQPYYWDGDLPKQVPAGSTPQSTGGIGKGAWVSVGDASLRGDLQRDSGASLIAYKKPYEGAVTRTAADYFNQEINIDDFGAKGDALLLNGDKNPNRTDDSAAIQKALLAAWRAGGVKVVATPWKSYYIAQTVYTLATYNSIADAEKNSFPTRRIQVIDLQGARFIGRDDTSDDSNVFIESGYLKSDGSISSVFGDEAESHLTYGTSIINATLLKFKRGFKLRNHIYGCTIKNIIGYDVQQIAYAERCFVSEWESISAHGSHTVGLARYHFKDNSNIIPLKTVACGNCDIGYIFDGATEAVKLQSCGIEGYKSTGIKFIGAAYNLELDSCYVESNFGYGIEGTTIKHITINNTWFYGTTTIFGELGDNVNVRWMPNNMRQSMTKLFDDTKASQYNLSDFYLENTLMPAVTQLPVYDTKQAMNVHQTMTAYDPQIGVANAGIVGKVAQCNGLQPIRINGRTSKGTSSGVVVGSVVSIESTSETTRAAVYSTGITYSDTQLVYVNVSVAYLDGIWNWAGMIIGNSLFKYKASGSSDITINNINNKLVVKTPGLRGTVITPIGGEIRII